MDQVKNQQILITRIIWIALFFSNCIFCYLVWSGLLSVPQGSGQEDILSKIPYAIAAVLGSMSFLIFKSGTDMNRLRNKFKNLPTELPAQMNAQYENLNQLSDLDKKRLMLRQGIFVQMVLSWALAEAINVVGIAGLFFNMPQEHYYYFFSGAISLMILSFPRRYEEIDRLM